MPKSIPGVMKEWKQGALHSGSSTGPVVTSQKQAIAIALSEQKQLAKKAPKVKRSNPLDSAMPDGNLPKMHTSKHN